MARCGTVWRNWSQAGDATPGDDEHFYPSGPRITTLKQIEENKPSTPHGLRWTAPHSKATAAADRVQTTDSQQTQTPSSRATSSLAPWQSRKGRLLSSFFKEGVQGQQTQARPSRRRPTSREGASCSHSASHRRRHSAWASTPHTRVLHLISPSARPTQG